MLEAFGYLASVITAISLMMGNIWKLRWFNLIGSLMLMIYAMVLKTWPVAVVNAFIVGVDLYYLWKLSSLRDMFSLMEVNSDDKTFLKAFLHTYGADIKKFFPEFNLSEGEKVSCVFILRNLMPVGLFIFENEGNGTAGIKLDYVIPSYRDLSNARFFYNTGSEKFISDGFREFVIRKPSKNHISYITKLGFAPAVDSSVWVKTLVAGRDII